MSYDAVGVEQEGKMRDNPYSLLFGREPQQVISRNMDIEMVITAFEGKHPTQQVYMITGVRGCGKTVFMTEVSKKIAAQDDWLVIELNPERNLLKDLAEKLNSDHVLTEIFRNARINLSFLGIGLDIPGAAPVTNIEAALERMLVSLKKRGKKLLITIDEVVPNPSVREFVHSFQIFVRKDLPVFLLMTGLYDNINALQNERSLTFLYRAPKLELQPLSVRAITDHYSEIFHMSREKAAEMADMTKGYSFAFQVLGYFTWENGGSYQDALTPYKNYLADYSYDKIWSELSPQDKKVSYGIASVPDGKISEIRNFLSMDTNHFNPYRKRLIKKGIITGAQYGYVAFILPYFQEYVLENYL